MEGRVQGKRVNHRTKSWKRRQEASGHKDKNKDKNWGLWFNLRGVVAKSSKTHKFPVIRLSIQRSQNTVSQPGTKKFQERALDFKTGAAVP